MRLSIFAQIDVVDDTESLAILDQAKTSLKAIADFEITATSSKEYRISEKDGAITSAS